jgi:hypothetical protein
MSRVTTWVRLSFALQRWELLFMVGGSALLVAGMLWIAWQAHAVVAIDPGCFGSGGGGNVCQHVMEQFNGLYDLGTKLLDVGFGVPFGMGLVLGVPLVAREIDHGTADMAWTLSRSRLRWLAPRIAFVALVVIGLVGVIAIASDVVAQAIQPGSNLAADFTWYGRRGGLLVMRGLLALCIGLAIGAIFGRQLPALLVAIFVSIAIFTAVSLGMDRWLETDAVATPYGVEVAGGRVLGDRVELPGGKLVSFADLDPDEGYNIGIGPDGIIYTSFDENGIGSQPIGRAVSLIVPGNHYPAFVLRESGVLGGLALLAGGLAFLVVDRRRPH